VHPWQQLAQVEREISGREYQQLLEQLKVGRPVYRGYKSWLEVVASLRATRLRDPATEELLRAVLGSHHENHDQLFRTILFAAFGPALLWIWRGKASWDSDDLNRWGNVYEAFFDAVRTLDPDEIPTGLAQYIFRRTLYGVRNHYRRSWRRDRRFVSLDELVAAGEEDGCRMEQACPVDQLDEGRRLLESLIRDGLSPTDALIVVATRIYKDTLPEIAGDLGLTAESAKKRRQRAEAVLRGKKRWVAKLSCPRSALPTALSRKNPMEGGCSDDERDGA